MTEDFVTYEQADKLCDLGFDFECIACYDENVFEITPVYSNYNSPDYRWNLISAPTLSQAQKWLREVYNISIEPNSRKQYNQWWVDINFANDPDCTTAIGGTNINSYEEALLHGLDYTLYMILNTTNTTKKRDKRVLRSKYKYKNE